MQRSGARRSQDDDPYFAAFVDFTQDFAIHLPARRVAAPPLTRQEQRRLRRDVDVFITKTDPDRIRAFALTLRMAVAPLRRPTNRSKDGAA
jgi:hypothetical protein